MSGVKTTGLDAVTLRVQSLEGGVRLALRRAIKRQAIELHRTVVEDKLSGQVLGQRTQKLRNSIFDNVEVAGDQIIGTVGANMEMAKYAAFWEYGFHGDEQVSEYRRYSLTVAARSERAQLKALKEKSGLGAKKATRLKRLLNVSDHAERLIDSGDIEGSGLVRAHTRRVDQDARSYLRSALADRATAIRAALTEAVAGALKS